MAQTTRQTNLLVEQDWTKIYQSFTNADFTSYDFETLRNSMINYIKTYYPEGFNDFIESSEYMALIDMIAFLGQSLAFRTDLNARENFMDTAQRRDSILKLARMLSYNPTRNRSASGLLKFDSVSTTESVYDSNGSNLANQTIFWNDVTNSNWLEQFTAILNASLIPAQAIGKPGNSQVLNGVQTDEYSIALNTTQLPVAPFAININSTQTQFEAISATSLGKNYIYEADPTTKGKFNILYQNDNNGNGSNNTGFFLYFKQGQLQASQFKITDAIPNNFITVATNNINNDDHWLYQLDVNNNPASQWTLVPAIPGNNVIYNQLAEKNIYQINSLNNDQVQLIFGDGSFASIPQGTFNFYYRTSNGLSYSISPNDIASVTIAFNYISVNNTVETLRVNASLKYTITNASTSQSLSSIKSYAPQQYYTQNRMITGEDYNIFPLTTFTSIQKLKAVNRISSGVSLYIDTLDPTGNFSSTNIFADDGIITSNLAVKSSTFGFLTTNDIYDAIYNEIIPTLSSTGMTNYYYTNYPRYLSPAAGNVAFVQTGNSTVTSYGYLELDGNVMQVGANVSGNLGYTTTGATLKFVAPAGCYFDVQHNIQTGNINGSGGTLSFYAAVSSVVPSTSDTDANQIKFGTVVPTGAIFDSIIPVFKNNLTQTVISTMVSQIQSKVNFGLTYNQLDQMWTNISSSDIGTSTDWLLKFTYANGLYNVEYRTLEYYFQSAGETLFYFDPTIKVYDATVGAPVADIIKILKINSQPTSNEALINDVVWDIYNVITQPDGYVDGSTVLIRSPETQIDGVPDNPDLFTTIVDGNTSRGNLYFQYKHNSPTRNRIDPTPVNIIDLYILTADYATGYVNWLRDLTGTVTEPIFPTSSSLEIAYSTLENYAAISDSLIYNPAKFKPLFGSKADSNLQARFQVVVNPSVTITDNEVKTRVIAAINNYFDINNWDFGETFYFSELAAYLHTTLAPMIASVLIVPASDNLVFGNYFQINAEPWEIITSAATVNDIDIISAVTAAQLNLGNTLVGTY